jgi:hypothetical protein
LGGALLYALDVPMRALQRLLGVPRIGWMFVAPNLAILALFRFLPSLSIFISRSPVVSSSTRRGDRSPAVTTWPRCSSVFS